MVVARLPNDALARPVALTGEDLTVEEVVRVARERAPVYLTPEAEEAIARSHQALEERRAAGLPIYGMTTGFGALDGCRVDPQASSALQRNLLRSHAAGVGEPLPDEEVRALLVARLNGLARGVSGARPEIPRALLAMLERGVVPRVPRRGSVGAADLAPLAHVGLVLGGEGEARTGGGPFVPAAEALARAGLEAPGLAGRDAFALINALSHSAGTAALAVFDAARLVESAELAVAAGAVALEARTDSFDERSVKGHPGSRQSAERLRRLCGGGGPAPESADLREPLSTRCAHHVLGACRDAARRAADVVETELNAAVDNPMIAADGWHTNNAAEFHGQHLAEALDGLASSLTSLAVASERRSSRLLDPALSRGLPAFLIHPGVQAGLHSGLMIAQYTAASLVAELRAMGSLATQSIPTCAGTEDHVSMSAPAARRARRAVSLAQDVIAIEFLIAFQAIDLRGRALPPAIASAHRALREEVPVQVEDRVIADDIARAARALRAGAFDVEV